MAKPAETSQCVRSGICTVVPGGTILTPLIEGEGRHRAVKGYDPRPWLHSANCVCHSGYLPGWFILLASQAQWKLAMLKHSLSIPGLFIFPDPWYVPLLLLDVQIPIFILGDVLIYSRQVSEFIPSSLPHLHHLAEE